MRKLSIYSIIITALFAASCGGSGPQGELVGVGESTDWYEPDPHGMVFIRQGSFNMGINDQDVPFASTAMTKTVSIDPFWMDATEITNSEYKQYVYWVRDSIAKRLLIDEGDYEEYKADIDVDRMAAIDPEYDHDDPETCRLNWEKEVEWDNSEEEYQEALSELFYEYEERFYKQKEVDTRKLIYEYEWVDLKQAAKRQNRYNFNDDFTGGDYKGTVIDDKGNEVPITDRSSFIMHGKINVYPDTLVWMQDYTYSYNEPLARMYFWHTAYNSYPVVGVNWRQANAFCIWRTQIMRNYQSSQGEPTFQDYRLPTEAEWEYAGRGGLALSMYPWGGPYTRNVEGCFIANFKPIRGNYGDDGANRTLETGKFSPNEFGLYDMAGNVSEWTSNAFDESAYSFTHDLNPDFRYRAKASDPPALKRKVVRGGSWKDVAYYLQVGVRTYEYQDTAKSYIGFRCVRSYMGQGADWDASNF
ncbi:MAG: SUMF1/EgtB/PvdO family nonheme iron enzyme [Bacteroidota bacterium]|nr:SUMF1/EgtB/PvdO family nonheme iron enzyme [Bacteroidota bacterium]